MRDEEILKKAYEVARANNPNFSGNPDGIYALASMVSIKDMDKDVLFKNILSPEWAESFYDEDWEYQYRWVRWADNPLRVLERQVS